MGPRAHGNWWKWNSWSISHTRLLTSTHRISAYTLHICKGCQGGYQELDRQETWGALELQRQDMGFLEKILCRKSWDLFNLSRNQLRILMALATGHCYLKQHLFKLGFVHSPCVVDASWHLKCLHRFFVTVRLWQTESLLYETRWHWRHLSAWYRTLFKVWDWGMNELKGCTKIVHDWSAQFAAVTALPYSILL